MENKQTAVEWLLEQIEIKNGKDFTSYYSEFIEQAKQIEREQIEDTFQDGKWDWASHITNGTESKDLAQYYNETYNK